MPTITVLYRIPTHYDIIQDGQNKKSHLLFLFLIRMCIFCNFYGRDLFVKKYYYIVLLAYINSHISNTPLLKINIAIQETKIIAWRSSRCTLLNTFAYRGGTWDTVQVSRIRNFAIQFSSSNGWTEPWQKPIKFLVDILNHAHWIRIKLTLQSSRFLCFRWIITVIYWHDIFHILPPQRGLTSVTC